MIVIKNIDFIEVENDNIKLMTSTPSNKNYQIFENIEQELIRGIRFRRSDGNEIVIGYSKQAQDILGISFEVFENLKSKYDIECENHFRTTQEMNQLKNKLLEINSASFWQRLKTLFFNIKL